MLKYTLMFGAGGVFAISVLALFPITAPLSLGKTFLLFGCAAGLLFMAWVARMAEPVKVDIWESQQRLMTASDQPLPSNPTIHNGTLLYYALILEEVAEKAETICAIIARARERPLATPPNLFHIHSSMARVRNNLKVEALNIRNYLKDMLVPVNIMLTDPQAASLLDDTTDIAVVVAGFGLSAGLPVREGYLEVASSNLSKVDRGTGKIKKDPSGKWIKGPDYRPPALGRVIRETRPFEDIVG